MNKTIRVIQLGQQPTDMGNGPDANGNGPEVFSTKDEVKFLDDFEYSQGYLTWTATTDPLKARDINETIDKGALHVNLFIASNSNFATDHGCKIRTFNVTIEEVLPEVFKTCKKCGSTLTRLLERCSDTTCPYSSRKQSDEYTEG